VAKVSLGQYTTVFQAEVYAIMACDDKNIKGATGKGTFIFLLTGCSQSVDNCEINSELVWDFHQSLLILAECNNVQLLWVPGHTSKGIKGKGLLTN
jgi:hypothetical protein